MTYQGQWHSKKHYFGMHYDLHAGEKDTTLGLHCSLKELVPTFKLMNPDFVQTDCKGHAGYVSWFSQTPTASVPPLMKKDPLMQWRKATKKLGLPLHCHYSGIWDKAAGAKYPQWCVVPAKPAEETQGMQNFCDKAGEKMCPRGPYLDELMIPQMLELIDRYDVDGFWIDGDMWAVEPCYCDLCRAAWTEQTGHKEPPTEESDDLWPEWWTFTLESFYEFVTRYCDAVHKHKPGVLVCSNWLQTFANPGEPKVPTDWISGDNSHVWGLDGSRCEARFLSTRGKHWDIMLWNFYKQGGMGDKTQPWVAKPVEMLMQEAAVLLSYGGAVQLYENPSSCGFRDGRLVPWRQKNMGIVGKFVKKRRALCQDTETIPQVAVLHSEHHIRNTVRSKNLKWGADVSPVKGATLSLLENHYGVDILDEWALLPRLAEFPVIVAPEREALSKEMAAALKEYVKNGGKLLVSGGLAFDAFGAAFLGVNKGKVEEINLHVPSGNTMMPMYDNNFRLVKPGKAKALGMLGKTADPAIDQTPYAAATLHKVGKGAVAYIPFCIFRYFERAHYPQAREFIGAVMKKLAGTMDCEADAPTCVDIAYRQKKDKQIVHLVNRSSGLPNIPAAGAIDEIPLVGPITLRIKCGSKPANVKLAYETAPLTWNYKKGLLTIKLDALHIHAAIVIE